MLDAPDAENFQPIRSLTKLQRRVLGTLIEKGLTTPDQYPLTLKSATSGCNQKNNRHPLTTYSEEDVQQGMEQLRELSLAAVVHTESGRTERYRHWMRKRFEQLTEAQLAIMGELLLRGRQQLGELRGRASRMVPIDSLESLRKELDVLLAAGFIQTDGLDRRGAEVDHNWYEAGEARQFSARASEPGDSVAAPVPTAVAQAAMGLDSSGRLDALEQAHRDWQIERQELKAEIEGLRDELSRLTQDLAAMRRDLGG